MMVSRSGMVSWEKLRKHWFLVVLACLIGLGIQLGWKWPQTAPAWVRLIDPRWTTALITLLMSMSLDGTKLTASFKAPGPVALGFLINVFVVPLLGLLLFPLQSHLDLKYGLLVASSVPCTLAAASVWTRKAGGNDAISLLVTLTTSTACFVVVPFWLSMPDQISGLWQASPLTGSTSLISLSSETRWKLSLDLILGALLPTLMGQGIRQILAVRNWANRNKPVLGIAAQSLILLMVLVASIKAGSRLVESQDQDLGLVPLLISLGSVAAVHTLAFVIGTSLSKRSGFVLEEQIAIGLAGSQKTLPTGLLIATELGRTTGMTYALFPMLMYHATQLIIDTLFADRYAQQIQAEQVRRGRETEGKQPSHRLKDGDQKALPAEHE